MSRRAQQLLAPVLDRQHQLVTPRQAVSVGVDRTTLRRMVAKDLMEVVQPGVYGPSGAPLGWEREMHAVTMSVPRSSASHRAGARLLGARDDECCPFELSVASKRRIERPGVIIHESRDIEYLPPVYVRGIPCTPPLRLAVDLGAVLGQTAYTTVMRELRRNHGVRWRQLAAILELHSRHGRNGCGPLRLQIERYAGVEGIPDTTLEQTFLDDLIDAAMPLPVCQLVVERSNGRHFRLDFAYPELLLAIEIDGPHHRDPAQKRYDAWRDSILEAMGWRIIRFDEVVAAYYPALVLREVREALRERGVVADPC